MAYAMVIIVTSLKSGSRSVSRMSLSVSRSTAEVARRPLSAYQVIHVESRQTFVQHKDSRLSDVSASHIDLTLGRRTLRNRARAKHRSCRSPEDIEFPLPITNVSRPAGSASTYTLICAYNAHSRW